MEASVPTARSPPTATLIIVEGFAAGPVCVQVPPSSVAFPAMERRFDGVHWKVTDTSPICFQEATVASAMFHSRS